MPDQKYVSKIVLRTCYYKPDYLSRRPCTYVQLTLEPSATYTNRKSVVEYSMNWSGLANVRGSVGVECRTADFEMVAVIFGDRSSCKTLKCGRACN